VLLAIIKLDSLHVLHVIPQYNIAQLVQMLLFVTLVAAQVQTLSVGSVIVTAQHQATSSMVYV